MSAKVTGGVQHGATVAIGATALPLTTETAGLFRGVLVKALDENAPGSHVYVGGATVSTANGMPLAPGESVVVEIARAVDLYVIGSTSGLEVRWLGV